MTVPLPREKDKAQRYSRWFTVWPSTHVNAGRTVEVMPVSEHEQFVASLNQSEPGSAYFTSPAMKRLADEHAAEVANLTEEIDLVSDQRDSLAAENERLEKAARHVVANCYCQPSGQTCDLCHPAMQALAELAPVNPQENE